jgi:hypothetical protein
MAKISARRFAAPYGDPPIWPPRACLEPGAGAFMAWKTAKEEGMTRIISKQQSLQHGAVLHNAGCQYQSEQRARLRALRVL